MILVSYITICFSSDNVSQHSQDEYVDSRNHTVENIIKTKRRDPQKQIHFQNDIEKLLELEHMLTLCSTEKDMITQDTVDILIENLCNIFVKSGQKTFGTYNVKEKNKNYTFKKENKPWFDLDCRFARQNYRKLKKRFKRFKRSTSPQNRLYIYIAMIDAEKHYKHTLD